MAVVNTNSANVAAALAAGAERVFPGHKLHHFNGQVEAANGDSIGSTYRLATIPSNFVPIKLELAWDALGGTCAADVGIYEMGASGAVVDADEFASGVSLVNAGAWTSELEESGAADIAKMGQPLWQRLGLTAQPVPGKSYDIVATLTAASAAAGTVAMILTGYYAN